MTKSGKKIKQEISPHQLQQPTLEPTCMLPPKSQMGRYNEAKSLHGKLALH